MAHVDFALENLLNQIGTFGRYQLRQCSLLLICAFLAGMHMFSLTFIAPTPKHRCFIEEIDYNITSSLNFNHTFDENLLGEYIPTKESGEFESCLRYSEASVNATVVSCDGKYVFDSSVYQESRVYEFGMVCVGKWKRAFIQSVYVFGVFNGALVCGTLADMFGRKRILCISAIFQFIFALTGAYMTNYILYCVSLFFYGFFGSGGAYITGFVLSMELINKNKRAALASIYSASFAVGVCSVAFWSYLVRDIILLQTIFALHTLLLFGHHWLIDESIRWLYGQGRIQEAVDIVRKACRENGLPFHADEFNELNSVSREEKPQGTDNPRKYGVSDLFKTPTLRFRSMITAFQWFTIALCFYGLAFNTGKLPGDPYLVFFIAGLVDLPGHFFVALVVNRTGRRSLSSALLFTGGVACIITTFIPKGLIVTTAIAMIAKSALAGCFSVMYNYTAELYPTVVRNSAVGLCAMAARLGGTLTPQITLLDSLDPRFPTLVFGCAAICSACMALSLPETLHKDLPQSLEDGENFRVGDNAFSSCLKRNSNRNSVDPEQSEKLQSN